MNYNPLKTAIRRKDFSTPTKILLEKNLLQGTILNYGCGHNEDTLLLKQRYSLSVVGYDRYNPLYDCKESLMTTYTTIFCNYVFNVIPSLQEHGELVKTLKTLGQEVYIAVRSDKKAIKETWTYDEDHLGYWSTKNTFQRFYTKETIEQLFGTVEYIAYNNSLILIKLKKEQ